MDAGGKDLYLCPSDARSLTPGVTSLSLNALANDIKESCYADLFVFLDCCRETTGRGVGAVASQAELNVVNGVATCLPLLS